MLIIGAGAHAPYGFPTGAGLKKEFLSLRWVADNTDHRSKIIELMCNLGIAPEPEIMGVEVSGAVRCQYQKTPNQLARERRAAASNLLNEFLDSFAGARVSSIDSYLAARNSSNTQDKAFIDVGKLLIAFFIDVAEYKRPIGYHDDDWIEVLFDDFLKVPWTLDLFLEAPPKIFTFNYDSFFERTLASHLVHQHRFTEEKAIESVGGLGINHIYGSVLDFQKDQYESNVEYFRMAMDRIRVIGEDRAAASLRKTSEEIRKAIAKSKRVYFLGFAFDELNANLLFPSADTRPFSNTSFFSTHKGISAEKIQMFQDRVPVDVEFFEAEKDVDCTRLISDLKPIFIRKLSATLRVKKEAEIIQ